MSGWVGMSTICTSRPSGLLTRYSVDRFPHVLFCQWLRVGTVYTSTPVRLETKHFRCPRVDDNPARRRSSSFSFLLVPEVDPQLKMGEVCPARLSWRPTYTVVGHRFEIRVEDTTGRVVPLARVCIDEEHKPHSWVQCSFPHLCLPAWFGNRAHLCRCRLTVVLLKTPKNEPSPPSARH